MNTKNVTAVLALAVLTAGCSSPTEPSTPGTSSESSATQSVTSSVVAAPQIPWDDVGPGWTLATWTSLAPTNAQPQPDELTLADVETTLYLVDPTGAHYSITEFPAPGDQGATPLVTDWSGDGSSALLNVGTDVIVVDLRTGEHTTFTPPAEFGFTAGFTHPNGEAVLVSTSFNGDEPGTLHRFDRSGAPQFTYPTDRLEGRFSGTYLPSPDGLSIVLGTDDGLVVMGNDGTVARHLTIAEQGECTPVRWWDADSTVLADCRDAAGLWIKQLWLVPVDGATPTALTAPNDGQTMPDLGDTNAWQLPTGTYVQAASACGTEYLARLEPDGTTTPVAVPEVDENDSVDFVGAVGSNLLLQAELSCGPGRALLLFDPAANTSTVLLGPPVNDGGVTAAVPYPGQD